MNKATHRSSRDGRPGGESPSKPPLPAFSEDGVDLTLIRWMLSLSPAERLAVLQANVRSIVRLRNANSGS